MISLNHRIFYIVTVGCIVKRLAKVVRDVAKHIDKSIDMFYIIVFFTKIKKKSEAKCKILQDKQFKNYLNNVQLAASKSFKVFLVIIKILIMLI